MSGSVDWQRVVPGPVRRVQLEVEANLGARRRLTTTTTQDTLAVILWDAVHANERGTQILARILERYFAP